MPVPGRTNNRLQVMLGRPANRSLSQRVVSDQGWRVAFAAWPVLNAKASTNHILNGLEQLLHACPVAGSEIQRLARAVAQEVLDRAGMRVGKIEDVDEVAHARSITGVVVCAQDLKMWSAS